MKSVKSEFERITRPSVQQRYFTTDGEERWATGLGTCFVVGSMSVSEYLYSAKRTAAHQNPIAFIELQAMCRLALRENGIIVLGPGEY